MRSTSNRPGRIFATTTHKYKSLDVITVDNIKLRPIIDQTIGFSQAVAKVVSGYLLPLSTNEYVINNTLLSPEFVKARLSMKTKRMSSTT